MIKEFPTKKDIAILFSFKSAEKAVIDKQVAQVAHGAFKAFLPDKPMTREERKLRKALALKYHEQLNQACDIRDSAIRKGHKRPC